MLDLPFEVDSVSDEKTYTYLDTTGRPTLVLKKKNVVSDFSEPIIVRYIFSI
jgi:oligosaccharyltransferase complex subunit alpha (ribophorin I)